MEERIKIVENGICVDIEQLKKIITDDWQEIYIHFHRQGYRGEYLYHLILDEIADYADGLAYRTLEKAQKELGRPNDHFDWYDLYPKSDIRSIGFEVLNFLERLSGGWSEPFERVTLDDIPVILEFLDTPSDKSLEAWDKWEKHWANLDYAERRKKLLENKENCENERKIIASRETILAPYKATVIKGLSDLDKHNTLKWCKDSLEEYGRTLIQNTYVNTEQLKEFIINEWQSKKLYKSHYDEGKRGENLYKNILIKLSDFADGMESEILENARKKFGLQICLDWTYPRFDMRSMGFKVLDLLYGSWLKIESLTTDDIPIILEFLDTPPDKALEAWNKWEKYWANLDYAKRRKKLLENAENNLFTD